MTKRFGELLSRSWIEYKSNFKLIFRVFLILYIIPSLVLSLFILHGLSGIRAKLSTLIATEGIAAGWIEAIKDMFISEIPALTIFAALILISVILGFIMSVTLVNFSFSLNRKNKPTTTSQAIKSASKYLGKYIVLVIAVSLALMGLYLLFIIPGIIFTFYWLFAAYILIGENRGVIESIKRSKQVVKGRWWRVLGYYLLLMLVFMGISLIFLIPGSILRAIFQSTVIYDIFSLASYTITIPLGILFLKNFYLDLKATKKK